MNNHDQKIWSTILYVYHKIFSTLYHSTWLYIIALCYECDVYNSQQTYMSSAIYKMFYPNRCFARKIFAHSIFISKYMH